MSDTDQILDPEDSHVAAPRKGFDPGFKRNISIIGGVLIAAVVVITIVIYGVKDRGDAARARASGTSIPTAPAVAGATPTDLTPADEARLGRVQGRESEEAKTRQDTYIPRDLVNKSQELQAPPTQANGPGVGYAYNVGDRSGQAVDPQREALIRKGLELQLGSLLSRMEAPGTQSAGPYQPPGPQEARNQAAATTATASATAASGATTTKVLVKGLQIAGARLVSPLDTSKTEFISAVIDSGPLSGAYLIGKGKMVGEEGVQLTFNRMTFNGESYTVNVTGLDGSTSSDAMVADIDRKLLSRYVFPIAFTTLQAYLTAVARPAQTVVASNASTQVVTPSATAREAVATGVAAGLGKAGEGLGQAKPVAFMPIDTGIALLFNEPVQTKVSK